MSSESPTETAGEAEATAPPRGQRLALISGATGLVGGELLPILLERFDGVRALSRSGQSRPGWPAQVEAVGWDGVDPGEAAFDQVDAVIHLAGEPIFGGLPTAARLERVRNSRIDSTRTIVDHLLALPEESRPSTFLCASAVGYYGDRGEELLDETSSVGSGLLAEVCRDWEAEAARAETAGVRVVRLRIGVVLSLDGGALSLMKTPFSLGVGGRLGDGSQFFPWIHLDDLVRVIAWALDGDVSGAVNGVAPEAVRNRDFTRELGTALSRPTMLPVPAFAVKLALGQVAGELLGSRRAVPARLQEAGFEFRHPTIQSALADLLA